MFKWTDAHAVFVPEIDAEHRAMFQVAEELYQLAVSGNASERITAGLRALLIQADEHFSHEERLMRLAKYPGLPWHKGQHETARKRVRAALRSHESGDRDATLENLKALSSWLRDHTGLTDRMMGAYLRNYERLGTAKAS